MKQQVYTAILSREQFLSWLGQNFSPRPKRAFGGAIAGIEDSATDIMLIWNSEPADTSLRGAKPVVAVAAARMRDFFAFVGTYVATYQPFSAFFRVIPLEIASELIDKHSEKIRSEIPNSYVGAIIAEARLLAGGERQHLDNLSVQACLATMSSSAVSALRAGTDDDYVEAALSRWVTARMRLSEDRLRVDEGRIAEFWSVVAKLDRTSQVFIDGDRDLSRVLEFLYEVSKMPDDAEPTTWFDLCADLPEVRNSLSIMRASREDRVRAMDSVIDAVRQSHGTSEKVKEVILGYLASRVAGGSLSYFRLLDPIEDQFPIANLWFGLFCSIRKETDVMTISNCLGRRVDRRLDGYEELFNSPLTDMSFDEFETIMLNSPSMQQFGRTDYRGSISLELLPTVPGLFRISQGTSDSTNQTSHLVVALDEIRYLLERAHRLSDSALRASETRQIRQRDLFRESTGRIRPKEPKEKTRKTSR